MSSNEHRNLAPAVAISSNDKVAEAIAKAKAIIAARALPKLEKTYGQTVIDAARAIPTTDGWSWNEAQRTAISSGRSGESFCLIGAAGTGKTTTLRELLRVIIADNKLPPLEKGTKHLQKGAPGVVLFSYTRRAVRNIAKQMPADLKPHCITGHKLLEFAPVKFEVDDGKGGTKLSMRFEPTRHGGNPLPSNLRLIIIDESSMVSWDFFQLVLQALPYPARVQFIFLGDLNQLPPVYGDAILGHKLIELPIVELTEVYRQALESPIIEKAIEVKDDRVPAECKAITKNWIKETARGKVTIIPWKSKLDQEEGCFAMQRYLRNWIKSGQRPNDGDNGDKLDFENDVILCPWNKAFGNIELNKAIGTELALKYDREVYEVIAGYNKCYFSIGDRVLHEKRDALITRIVRNTRYIGKLPQPHNRAMDYWGYTKTPVAMEALTEEEIEESFGGMVMGNIEDRTHEASHAIYLKYVDQGEDESETILSASGDINKMELAYCMSVHKSQGSEWKRVIFITHDCHQKMLSRELVYTAITRASQELIIFMAPMMLTRAAKQHRIKGNTLAEKLKFFTTKAKELQRSIDDEE
jgi:exodeoxyribonuclease V alpha subunit